VFMSSVLRCLGWRWESEDTAGNLEWHLTSKQAKELEGRHGKASNRASLFALNCVMIYALRRGYLFVA
jgi:hypothetical protein